MLSTIFIETFDDGFEFFSNDDGIKRFCVPFPLEEQEIEIVHLPDNKIVFALPVSNYYDINNNIITISQTIAICWDFKNSSWTFITSPIPINTNIQVKYYESNNTLYFITGYENAKKIISYDISNDTFDIRTEENAIYNLVQRNQDSNRSSYRVKSSKINLWNTSGTKQFQIAQTETSSLFSFNTNNLNLKNISTNQTVLDALGYLRYMDSIDSNIDTLETRVNMIETDIDFEQAVMENESDINILELRSSMIEIDINAFSTKFEMTTLESRDSKIETDLAMLDSQYSMIESDINTLDFKAFNIDNLKFRTTIGETDIDDLEHRASVVETDINILQSQTSVVELDIELLKSKIEIEFTELRSRIDSNISILFIDKSEWSILESNIYALENQASLIRTDIVDLENDFTLHESDVVDIKETLYALSDGNVESMLSSLHGIADSFESNTNMAEDLINLKGRLTGLISVVQVLTIYFELRKLNPISIGAIQSPTFQSDRAIAIGESAGQTNQNDSTIAIGKFAGQTNQGVMSIAMGKWAGSQNQSDLSLAVGMKAGYTNQSTNAIAFGTEAGVENHSEKAIAVGMNAGYQNQGEYSIALGAYAGKTNQYANSIILNASGNTLSSNTGTCISRVGNTSQNSLALYNSNSKEVSCSQTVDGNLKISGNLISYDTSLPSFFKPNSIPSLSTSNLYPPFLETSGRWSDCVLAPNGKIYFVPNNSTYILVVDPTTDTIVNRIEILDGTQNKWRGGVLAPNGKIYCVPSSSTYVLIIDTTNDTVDTTSITGIATTVSQVKYDGGVFNPIDGKIYCIPRSATSVLIIDPDTDTANTTLITSLLGIEKYASGALVGGKIYCAPANTTNVLVIDPSSPISTLGASFGINPTGCTVTSQNILNCNAGANLIIPAANITQVARSGGIASITLSGVPSTWFLNIGNEISIFGITNDNNTFNTVMVPITNISGNIIFYANPGVDIPLQTATGTARFISRINIGDNILLTTTLGNFTAYVSSVTSATVIRFISSISSNLALGQITQIQRTRRVDITTFRGIVSSNSPKYLSSSLLSDGKVYMTPFSSDNVLILDLNSSIQALPGTHSSASYVNGSPTPRLFTCPGANFLTSVSIGDNLLIDFISSIGTGRQTGIIQSIIDNDRVVLLVALGTNITAGQIANIRVSRQLDFNLTGLPSGNKWAGAVVASSKIYAIPFLSTNSLVVDPNSPTTSLISTGATYTNATRTLSCPNESFLSSVTIGDNLIINTTGVVVSGALTGQRRFTGYVQSIQSNTSLTLIYALGQDLSSIQISGIEKNRKLDLTFFTNLILSSTNKYLGGCLGSNGKIYGASFDQNNIYILNPTSPRINILDVTPSLCSFTDNTRTLFCPGASFATPGLGQVNIGDNIVLSTNTIGGDYMGYVETVIDNQTLVFFSANDVLNTSTVFGINFTVGQITAIQKTQVLNTSSITFGNGAFKYTGGVLAPNRKIYGIPSFVDNVLIIDPTNNTFDTTTLTGFITDNFFGSVLAPNGKIYCIPLLSKSVKVIDPMTNVTETIFTGSVNFGCTGGVLALNGKIYCIPYDASATSVPIIDPVTNAVDTTTIPILPESNRWIGGVLAPNGKIYGIPANSARVLIIDPVTNTVDETTLVVPTGGAKWFGGVLGIDGKIYGVPFQSSVVLIIDPVSNTVDTTSIKGLLGNSKWVGGTLAQDGKIYCVPNFNSSVLVLDPSSPITSIPGVTPSTCTYTNSSRVFFSPGATFLTSLRVGDNILITTSTTEYTNYVQSITDNQNVVFVYNFGVNLTAGQITSVQKTRKADVTTITFPFGGQFFAGSVLSPNGDIYMMPRSAGYVLVTNPELATQPNWMIKAYFNKF
jgi:hypothetical protein